jgi:hypothetical protein
MENLNHWSSINLDDTHTHTINLDDTHTINLMENFNH